MNSPWEKDEVRLHVACSVGKDERMDEWMDEWMKDPIKSVKCARGPSGSLGLERLA